ncbi:MAG TPA: Gfo/Idh/MocA family oxidoreductase [Bryobacteraceae bacterium]|nr:Gfo/Idh/MocA family oxidoreductase [Bryobacteraceae bacterium]
MPMQRRAFLGAAAAAAATAGDEVRFSRKIRVGILGLDGHVSEITGPLPRLPEVEIAAVSDPSSPALARLAKNPRVAAATQYADYKDMLEREKLDVVAVCNNNGDRAEAVLACLARGLNVVAEKPLAIRRADYLKIRKAVEASKLSFGHLLPMRYDPPYLALKAIVESGELGDIVQISSQKSYKASGSPEWRRNRATYGSSILWIGIHMIDLMRWSSGREMIDASSWQRRVGMPELKDQENVTASVFQLDNGGLAILRMDYLRPDNAPSHGDDRLRLGGTKGVAEYMAATGVTVVSAGSKQRTVTELPPAGSLFVDYLRATYSGAKPSITLDDIWKANEVTFAAHEAAEKGSTVKV